MTNVTVEESRPWSIVVVSVAWWPEGHVGLCKAQVWTIPDGGVKETNLPFTPPPNITYSVSALAADCAGARDHIGMRFSSVSKPKRSSAAAINEPSTVIEVVFILLFFFFSAGWGAGAAVAGTLAPVPLEVEAAGAGVPDRLGSVLTVRSLPCVSTIATANSANLVSRAVGSRDLARAKIESTSGEEAVVRVQM